MSIVNENCISISKLMQYPSPETILFELLLPFNFSRFVAEDIFSGLFNESGKIFYSPTHRLVKDRDNLLITLLNEDKCVIYTLDNIEGEWNGPVKLSFNKTVINKEFTIEKDKNIAYFDYDSLTFPLTLRRWNAGDWFIPFGMKGRKKISDYYSDHKYSLVKKEETWLLCSGNDIIWIVGERTDNRYRVKKSSDYALIVNFLDKRQSDK